MDPLSKGGIAGAIRESLEARFTTIEWSKTTRAIMKGYKRRLNRAARSDDPEETVRALRELWDRLVMHPDAPNTRLGLAHVGVEFMLSMQVNSRISGVPLSEVCESLGGMFYEIREGRRVSYAISNAAGERREVTFERGERTMTLPGGAPVPKN